MHNDNIEITNAMHLKEKLEKATGNMVIDMLLLITSTIVFGISGLLYFYNPDYRLAIIQVFFLSLIATIICNCEFLHSLKTLNRIRACTDASESKLIDIDRVTAAHFHTGITLMSVLGLIVLVARL